MKNLLIGEKQFFLIDENGQNSYFIWEEDKKDETLRPIIANWLKSVKYIEGDITTKGGKLLNGKRVKCNRKKSMIVNEDTIKAEGLGNLFKNKGKASVEATKNN